MSGEPLDAGRDLDDLVAEKVMGWKLFEVGYQGTEDETPEQRRYAKALDRQGDNAVGTYAYIGGGKVIAYDNGFCDLFQPSTDIAAAWLVVDKLMETAFSVDLHANHADGWWCAIDGIRITADETVDVAPTAPLAICRAALAASSLAHKTT